MSSYDNIFVKRLRADHGIGVVFFFLMGWDVGL